jgi:magnesium transporter
MKLSKGRFNSHPARGGNTGAQALGVTMRGLALREIRLRHWFVVTWKEARVAFLNGVVVALTTAFGVWFWSGSTGLSLVIGLSMVLSMVAAGLAGAAIPMMLTERLTALAVSAAADGSSGP